MPKPIPELIQAVCEAMVHEPVTIQTQETETTLIIEIRVPQRHLGIMIGRQGRHIDALRTLAEAMGSRTQRVYIEVCE